MLSQFLREKQLIISRHDGGDGVILCILIDKGKKFLYNVSTRFNGPGSIRFRFFSLADGHLIQCSANFFDHICAPSIKKNITRVKTQM